MESIPNPVNPAIELRGVVLRFGDFAALRQVDLLVPPGEKLVIFGPSGSGKSSVLRCVSGLERPDEGEVRIFGTTLDSDQRALRAARLRMGMIFQQLNLYVNRTILDNVALGPQRLKKLDRRTAEEMALAHLADVGVADLAKSYPFQLSGGQQQRVAIARALVMEPDIILLDEPTSALDPELVRSMLDLIARVAESRTVVCVTHELGVARRLAERAIFMADGIVVEEGTPAGLFERPQSERLQRFLSQIVH
jgi:ABC-type polar amino acid transport system ATPase subunit